MTSFLKSYHLKIVLQNNPECLAYFKRLTITATNQLMVKLWSEDWIKQLGRTKSKAHSIVDAKRVSLELDGQIIYLPSRVRMGIAEQVGRILRGQYKRMRCFYDCLEIIELVGWRTHINSIIKLMNATHRNKKHIPFYKKVMLDQTIRMIKNWYKKLKVDFQMLSYCDLVKPRIKKFTFIYGPDNYRELKYEIKNKKIYYEIKLPTIQHPKEKKDWQWISGEISIPEKIQHKINKSIKLHPKKPELIIKVLKGGLHQYFLAFPWEFIGKLRENQIKNRVLSVDLGIKKFATAVVCENKYQIGKPLFLILGGKQYHHIERLYKHIDGLNKQLSETPNLKRKNEERTRLYRKLSRIREELAQLGTNLLIRYAVNSQCEKIILEDLRLIKPRRGQKKWSREMNEWLRGRITQLLELKCQEEGLKLQKVNPWRTSSDCPRCTSTNGQKVNGSNNLMQKKEGRWFYCPECGFSADRDYIATLNIYRASFIDYKKIRSLRDTSPITYPELGIPSPDCSWRRSRDEPETTQIVMVTGG